MTMICPHCRNKLESADEIHVGEQVQCPVCGKTFQYGLGVGCRMGGRPSRISLPPERECQSDHFTTRREIEQAASENAQVNVTRGYTRQIIRSKKYLLVGSCVGVLLLAVLLVFFQSNNVGEPSLRRQAQTESAETTRLASVQAGEDKPIEQRGAVDKICNEAISLGKTASLHPTTSAKEAEKTDNFDVEKVRNEVSEILLHKSSDAFNWKQAWDQLEKLRLRYKSGNAQIVIDAGSKAISYMRSAQKLLISFGKGHEFRVAKLKGKRITAIDETSITVAGRDGSDQSAYPWYVFCNDYVGNLNELFNAYILRTSRGGVNTNSKGAALGSALLMRTICPEVSGAYERSEQIAKQFAENNPGECETVKLLLRLTGPYLELPNKECCHVDSRDSEAADKASSNGKSPVTAEEPMAEDRPLFMPDMDGLFGVRFGSVCYRSKEESVNKNGSITSPVFKLKGEMSYFRLYTLVVLPKTRRVCRINGYNWFPSSAEACAHFKNVVQMLKQRCGASNVKIKDGSFASAWLESGCGFQTWYAKDSDGKHMVYIVAGDASLDDQIAVEASASSGNRRDDGQQGSTLDLSGQDLLCCAQSGKIVGALGFRFGSMKRGGGRERIQTFPSGEKCHSNSYEWRLSPKLYGFSTVVLCYTKKDKLWAVTLEGRLNPSRSKAEINEIVNEIKNTLHDDAGLKFNSRRTSNFGFSIYSDDNGCNGDSDVSVSVHPTIGDGTGDSPSRIALNIIYNPLMFEGF